MARPSLRLRVPPVRSRAAAAMVAVLLPVVLLTGACDSLSGTGDKGFVTGDGTVRIVAAVDRGDPVELSGEDLQGKPLDIADLRGRPTVVVVWGSWCAPCRAEAPDVVAAAKELGDRAHFVGIDLRNATTADPLAYEQRFDIPYRSFFSPDGQAMLSFPGTLGPNTIPAFVVLDADGRVAGSIVGALPSTETLVDLVGDVTSGGTGGAAGGTSHG